MMDFLNLDFGFEYESGEHEHEYGEHEQVEEQL
jgi:hypothetical protein